MHPRAQSDPLDSLLDAFADPSRRSTVTHLAAARGAAAIPAIRAILDGTARNAFGVNPYGLPSEPFRCALVTARLIGPEARALIPLIADAFRRGMGTSACEALLALTAIAPTDEDTAAILAEALARDPELASTAAGEIIRLKLVDHPVIIRTLAGSKTARAALDWASGAKPI